jgi:hypothetical protein
VLPLEKIEMAKELNIFDFSKHSKDLFLVAGSQTARESFYRYCTLQVG